MTTTTTGPSNTVGAAAAPNLSITVRGETFVYRRTGTATEHPPLILMQHFRGNLDFWDPRLVDTLGVDREVIAFDNRGVGASSGETPDNITDMARDAIAFVEALALPLVDLLGFSLGGHIAQEFALMRPRLVRRMVLAGTAPMGAPGLHRWNDDVYQYATQPTTSPEDFIALFFSGSGGSTAAAWDYLQLTNARQDERDIPTDLATRDAQLTALTMWGIPDASKLERLSAISQPVLVAVGDDDTMMMTENSRLLAEHIRGAQLRIYPDAGHGFLDQYPVLFGEHIRLFLGR